MEVAIGVAKLLGFGPLGATPLGAAPLTQFDLEREVEGRSLIQIVPFVDRALIEKLKNCPNELRHIDRRKFEEVVAEIFDGFGYEVELTKQTRDGGKDIIAIKRREVNLKYLIECKRPDPGNIVGVAAVRQLWGVKGDEGASKAILVTTTGFSADAKAFVDRHTWELEARDFEGLQEWLDDYLRLKS
ncbi:MAG: restriction endonuclease [Hyphomicrobium sp.]